MGVKEKIPMTLAQLIQQKEADEIVKPEIKRRRNVTDLDN